MNEKIKCSLQQAKTRRADVEDQEEEDDGQAQEAQELLDQINENKEQNGGHLDDQYVIQFFRERLKSMPCQNQGFILDGFPKTVEQAKDLFAGEFRHISLFPVFLFFIFHFS